MSMKVVPLLPSSRQHPPAVIAHALGGCAKLGTGENSPLSLALSVATGVDAVELDVVGYPAANGGDGQLLVTHDVSASRGTNVAEVLATDCQRDPTVSTFCTDNSTGTEYRALTRRQLSMLRRPVDGSSLQMLPELMQHLGRLWQDMDKSLRPRTPPMGQATTDLPIAMVELKRIGWHKQRGMSFMSRRFLEVAAEYESTVRVIAASFEESVLQEMRAQLASPLSQIRLLYDSQATKMTTVGSFNVVAGYAEALGVSVEHLNGRADAAAFVETAHEAGLAVYVFVVNNRTAMQPYSRQLDYLTNQLGVDGLITDNVGETNEWLKSSFRPTQQPMDLTEGQMVQLRRGTVTAPTHEFAFVLGALTLLALCLAYVLRYRRQRLHRDSSDRWQNMP